MSGKSLSGSTASGTEANAGGHEKIRQNQEIMLDKSGKRHYNICVFKQSARSHLPAIAPRHGL
jgi:hypothetical protein